MRNEIYQRFWKTKVIKTKANKLIEAKIPRGVFVARKTNKGEVFVSLSLVHKNDKFNIKDGLNAARRNVSKIDMVVYLTDAESKAFDCFQERAEKYFRVGRYANWQPTNKSWKGLTVEHICGNLYYFIREDHGDRVDCSVNDGGKVRDCVYTGNSKKLFIDPFKK